MSWEDDLRGDEPCFDDFGDGDGDDEHEFDCHMDASGYCGAAGSEDCEFECPYRRMYQ
jgi:hypothetical protein